MNNKNKKIYLEIVVIFTCITLINIIFFKDDPGFYKQDYIFYWMVPIFIVIFYGNRYIYISLISEVIFLILNLFILLRLTNNITTLQELSPYLSTLISSQFIGVVLLFTVSIFVNRYEYKILVLTNRLKKISLELLHYKRSTRVLEIVNKEFETQLSKSHSSITALYTHLYNINKLNKAYVLDTILDTIVQFTGVKKATIWEFNSATNKLELSADFGHSKNELPLELDIKNSVEGYVFRNNQFFTIRKLSEFSSIIINKSRHNIMTFPIHIGNDTWGVLNIADIPFEKYSRYNEQLIHIIIQLSQDALKNSINYELSVRHQDLDNEFQIPLFTQLYSYLEDKLEVSLRENSSVVFIIIEIINYDKLIKEHGKANVVAALKNLLIETFNDYNVSNYMLFRYKKNNQFSLLINNIDEDGLSYYIVSLFKNINNINFIKLNYNIRFDLGIGYSFQKNEITSIDDMLLEAESLLKLSEY